MNKVWIIDDDRSIRWVLEKALQKGEMATTSFSNGADVLTALEREQPDVILSDIRMPGMDGLTLLNRIKIRHPDLPVIIMTAHSDLDSAVSAYDGGAFEYLPKPFDLDEAVEQVRKACRATRRSDQNYGEAEARDAEIIGEAPAMQEVFRAIGRLAKSNITVLLNGESGTGKELVAHALHRHSPRTSAPFIALNMAAIPRELLESELFGHEKGAFTGAQGKRRGRFEQANGGTLFLDEIGDMPAELQTRLLRVLATGEFYCVGGHEPVRVDVRIIAATHQDLEKLVATGRFREDLFHRLNVIRLHLPSLRERREDIPLLMNHFLKQAAKELGVGAKRLLPETNEALKKMPWPGNVRQLENIARWLTVMASGQEIHSEDLPLELTKQSNKVPEAQESDWQTGLKLWARNALREGRNDILKEAIPQFERTMLEVALAQTGGRKQEAALLLGWGRNTLTRKLKELNVPELS
ncbi:MAG: nitrogen regulation protein NR(I) [Gammaproteobacteria bacterium]|nr:nitrogen regulation protein NR(I) [Gammaproteobacteria bacterium]MBU1656208.1 nitrogen regulation protein NR(I) [Gammaproteobacteria bacterium]MBU1959773.1 nitrogen regulation protein NR(I) [Gammaproteobacteria bacterium]